MMIQRNQCLPILEHGCTATPRHPKGDRARVLLTSVFGPYAQDDEYGSRKMNPMELYHNQVTRTQGPFSLRMFHRSWGLMLIQANINAPCVVLDFPELERFIDELQSQSYDVIGITSIIPNQKKAKVMCELIRKYQPQAEIVIGGHIANMPDLDRRIDADHIVRGEGVRWFREYLGEATDRPFRHPLIKSGIGTRNIGIKLSEGPQDVAATVIPSVGCPLGCNFCSTSAMFGGKGKFINFYETGDELFHIMCRLEEEMGVCSFFMMDENFLLHKNRALRLLELMEANDKAWALYVFSSANVLKTYTTEQLLGLGISWVWMGLEGEDSQYSKLKGTDAHKLVWDLQSHGIKILGSSIIGLENHTMENIDEAIDYSVSFDTDFHQFMLYSPIAGTPLHKELTEKGVMKDESTYDPADIHGQYIFNYRHPHIPEGAEAELVVRAFDRDFAVNGPSVVRIAKTTLAGYRKHKNHPNPRIRRRFRWEAKDLGRSLSALVGASRRYYKKNPELKAKMDQLLKELHAEFGLISRFFSSVGGLYASWTIRREIRRLADGVTYEPPTFYERNEACTERSDLPVCAYAEPIESIPQNRVKHHIKPAREAQLV